MDYQTACAKVLELVVCDYKKGKCTEQCLTASSLPCTGICKGKGKCQNEVPESFFISDEELEK